MERHWSERQCRRARRPFGDGLTVESLLRLIGPDWKVPDFSTLSRRQKPLTVNIPYRGSDGPLHLLIDSAGIKVEGEGEWNARKHGGSKRRVWRKIHIGIDEKTPEIRAAEFTTSDIGDAPMLPELLDQIPPEQEIATVTADGAFDTRKCHDAIAARGAAALAIGLEPMAPQWLAPAPQERQTLETRHRRGARHCPRTNGGQCLAPQRDPAHIEARRPDHLATMERLSPPKPRRNQDALCQAPRPAPLRAPVRPSGGRIPGPRHSPLSLGPMARHG